MNTTLWRPIDSVPKDGTGVLLCKAIDADGKSIRWDCINGWTSPKERKMETVEKTFWLVWNPAAAPPRVKHPTAAAAQAEAERLASRTPGQTFFVLASIMAVETQAIKITKYKSSALREPWQ